MEHPAFAEAGSKEGLEIWTIDKFEPVAIENTDYGKFYNGDAYIVLKSTGDEDKLSYEVHFWLGAESTQDKQGAAAILTVVLDEALGGRAVHSREVQRHESAHFLGYFKPAVRYLEGGLESGFNQVTTNAGAEKRLLKLTGCDNLRISEVPADISSLNRTNCFILEVEHDIFVLLSSEAKATQRRKIISIATKLRDDEHNGRATIEIIDEFSPREDVKLFFEALGSGCEDEVQEDSGDEQSELYSREGSAVLLFRVSGVAGELELTALGKPHKQSQLTSDSIYILDTPASGIYIWIGTDVDAEEKKTYSSFAQTYLEMKGYPSWVHVTKVAQGAENSAFKQFFTSWEISASSPAKFYMSAADEGYHSGDADEAASSAREIAKTGAARGFMPDDASGTFVVYKVEGSEPVESYTSESDWQTSGVRVGAFFTSDAYVIKYQYTDGDDNDAYILYYWIGSEADADEGKAAADIAANMNEELGGEGTIVKVPQGKETKHFLKVFKGNLLVLLGGKTSEYRASNANSSYDDDEVRLFKVAGTEVGADMRAVQVAEQSDSLEDDGVFVLETRTGYYVWSGKEASSEEQEAAQEFLKSLASGEKEIMSVEQGDEPEEFWEALGGQSEQESARVAWTDALSRRVNVQPKLVDVTLTIQGQIRFERVPGFAQEDLSEDSYYILDTGEEIYLWRGASVPERVKNAKDTIMEEYLRSDELERQSAVVVSVKQGKEPELFRRLFPAWDTEMWPNQTSYEDLKAETKAANSK